MEFPNLGVQCSAPNCQQLDFLPYECACELIFCGEHFNKHVIECPTRKDVYVQELKQLTDLYLCSHPKCKVKSLVLIECPMCGKHFCIRHRHINQCKANKAEKKKHSLKIAHSMFKEAKAEVDKQLDVTLTNAMKKEKTLATATKVQLMRLKQKAIGMKSIPISERIYFSVVTSKSPTGTAIFVSSVWTIGRCIDAMAEFCGLVNNNNKKDSKKLRLFRKNDGTIVGDTSATIDGLMKQQKLANGDCLILEYVYDGCEKLQDY